MLARVLSIALSAVSCALTSARRVGDSRVSDTTWGHVIYCEAYALNSFIKRILYSLAASACSWTNARPSRHWFTWTNSCSRTTRNTSSNGDEPKLDE